MHATSDWQQVMATDGRTQAGWEYRDGGDGVLYARPMDYQKRVSEYQEAAERAFVLSMALEKVLPFVGKTPVAQAEREAMAAAVSVALKLLKDDDKEG